MRRDIIFDLDGTLITCKEKHVALCKVACNLVGVSLNVKKYWDLKRNGASNKLALSSYIESVLKIERICSYWNDQIEESEWLYWDKLYPNTLELLSFISRIHNIHILTARRNKFNAYMQCDELGLSKYVSNIMVVSHDDVSNNKKDYILKTNASLFFGDTETDYIATLGTNCDFVAFINGQRSYNFLKNSGVDKFSSINETLENLTYSKEIYG
ncbi:HAD family hydrolase [Vibrio vulnificus]|uniref:HAD family hydrolase n=1 Tax=Vibrio TaxID=662 RepID=UPI001867D42C|nr:MULTISPECIES: HAD family hydrolase [Vibrio]MBE3655669.1 hypothetical protein [Vibrio navarrensis]MBN8106926.1 HAD family hydrolase [Vibrio vulnificus]MDT8826508.1 HAD family hydrolase [Vibrio vulnificus]